MAELVRLQAIRVALKDLAIEDIQTELIEGNIFTQAEIKDMLDESNEDNRLMLFYTIVEQKWHKGSITIVRDFMQVLRPFHDWIVKCYEENSEALKEEINSYYSYKINTAAPTSDELNIYRRQWVWQVRKCLLQLEYGVHGQRYLFVYGGFGTGKMTLVRQACENYSIVKHMNYCIYYLSLANCTADEQILEQLENLSIQMRTDYKTDDITYKGRYPTNEIYKMKRHLKQQFENQFRDSLLILSHVRNPSLIEKFDLKCKTLIITSRMDVIKQVNKAERFVVELEPGFTEDESIELFGTALRVKADLLPTEAHDIHQTCKGNPFVIKLIARKMSEYADEHNRPLDDRVLQVWQNLAKDLKVHSLRIEQTTIQSILGQLSPEEQHAFRSLVIFRDNVKIPQSVLQRYWEKTSHETETLVTQLTNKGLLDKRKDAYYVLHYVCYSFLKENASETNVNLHRQLVKSYRIPKDFRDRTELDLQEVFRDDNYFHFYIATHLEHSEMYDLFPKLFMDFGFLEQKIRYTGLPNTVGDLRLYQKRIFSGMKDPDFYAESLTEFLMGAEVLLSKSADTCLLQLALNCTGMIGDEAKRQASQYNNRVWFYDIDHIHQHQLVRVDSGPCKVRFQDTGSALVSLKNNKISLVDLSPLYAAPVTMFDGNHGPVKDMQMVNSVLVALDDKGTLNIWSMKHIPQDRNARQHGSDSNSRAPSQSLCSSDPIEDPFVSFCLVIKENPYQATPITPCDLFAITRKGFLYFYTGTSSFLQMNRLKTRIVDTYMMKPLSIEPEKKPKLLFLTEDHRGYIFNLMSTSIEHTFEERQVVNVHYTTGNSLVSVCTHHIQSRTLQPNDRNQLVTGPPKTFYETPRHHQNTCSAISEDSLYIILGTTQGIFIVSIKDGSEVLRTNISQDILDVDVFSLDDDRYRYILISSSKDSEKLINLYSLMVTADNQLVSNQHQLQGHSQFLVDLDYGPVTVKTVDRKCKIRELQYCTDNERDDFVEKTPTSDNTMLASEVHQLIQCPSGFLIGLKNGDVLLLKEWNVSKEGPKPETLLSMGRPICLLKYYEAVQLLVAATDKQCKLITGGQTEHRIGGEICECYLYLDRFLVLIYEDCTIQIMDTVDKGVKYHLKQTLTYSVSAFNEPCLIICTNHCAIYQMSLSLNGNGVPTTQELYVYQSPETQSPPKRISSCAVSNQKELLAIGYRNGPIEVYNAQEHKLLATLESHNKEVSALYFSPWQNPNSPHVLVSVGEQIVFWCLNYVINNPWIDSKDSKRLSNRYKSPRQPVSPAINIHHRSSFGSRSSGLSSPFTGSPARDGSFAFDTDELDNQWLNKAGPSDKPQLLSCIKLIGSAKKLIISGDFTKFFTIDDEGHIYYLRLFQPNESFQF